MREKTVVVYETAKNEFPPNGSVAIVWTILLGCERAIFKDGKFYMSDGRKWMDEELLGVHFWCGIFHIEK